MSQFWPMRWKRKAAARHWEKVSLFPKRHHGKRCPPPTAPHQLPVLKINMSNCDSWTCGSHSGAMRRAHVGAKPSAEGNRAERKGTWGHKTLLELWIVSCLELSPTLVMYNIQPSHRFSQCQSGFGYLQPKSFLTDINI